MFGFFRDTILVEEPVWVEDRGKRVKSFTGVSVPVAGCNVQPGPSSVDRARRDNVQVRFTVYAPAGLDVSRFARVTVGGVGYSLNGIPEVWKSPTGGIGHVVLELIDWEG